MARKLNGHKVVDLDHPAHPARTPKSDPAPAPRSGPRRQCPYCFTNRIGIAQWAQQGCEDRALQALRRAHPDEDDELVHRERETAEAATVESWELHMANQCKRAQRIAGTATNHHGGGR